MRLNAIKTRLNLPVILITLLFILAFLMTVLPYTIYKPYFPFTGDFQHPQNIASILNHGEPYPITPAYLKEQYPDSFGFLGAIFASLTGLDALNALIFVSSGTMLAALAAIYFVARELYGNRAAIFALFAYGLLSYQPRQTYFDGTFIELVSGLVLTPLFLLALLKTLTTSGWHWPALAGVMAAALVRYHFIGSVQAAVTGALFLAGVFVFRRDLITKKLLMALGLALLIALVLSFPYSFYYIRVALRILLGRLGLMAAATEQEAAFPALSFPGDFYTKLGVVFYHIGLMALGGFVFQRITRRKLHAADLLVLAWIIVMVFGSVTSVFIVPERFLRNLALPAALLIGAFLAALKTRPWLMAFALAVMLIPSMIFLGRRVTEHSANLMAALPMDEPSLTALGQIRAAEPDRLVLTDESGPWATYFADRNSFYIHGGPESFTWTGEPIRSDSLKLWNAYQTPCDNKSQTILAQYNIGYVYLGRFPSHWSPPGYAFQDGSRYLACPRIEVKYQGVITNVYTDTVLQTTFVITDNPFVFRLLKPDEAEANKPTWLPTGGLTVTNALSFIPPKPQDNQTHAAYYRRWAALARIALGDVLGYSPTDAVDLAAPRLKDSLAQIWQDIADIRQAKEVGVQGDARAPEYHFKLWRAAGKPSAWPVANLTEPELLALKLPRPSETLSTQLVQDWYVANYMQLVQVYVGDGAVDRQKIAAQAKTLVDSQMVYEITIMQVADRAGVRGDPDHEKEAFKAWQKKYPDALAGLFKDEE